MTEGRIHKGGKKPAWYLREAMQRIESSLDAISTMGLAKLLSLDDSEVIGLRRGLRRAAAAGRILLVGRAADGSFAWKAIEDDSCPCDCAALGAAYAAELYLKERLGPETAVDIEATRKVIAATLTTTTD